MTLYWIQKYYLTITIQGKTMVAHESQSWFKKKTKKKQNLSFKIKENLIFKIKQNPNFKESKSQLVVALEGGPCGGPWRTTSISKRNKIWISELHRIAVLKESRISFSKKKKNITFEIKQNLSCGKNDSITFEKKKRI